MTDRKAFEKFAISQYKNISLEKDDGEYRFSLAETQWIFWQASRKQALLESIDACKMVADQLVVGTSEQYEVGREMGATICKNTIEELLK